MRHMPQATTASRGCTLTGPSPHANETTPHPEKESAAVMDETDASRAGRLEDTLDGRSTFNAEESGAGAAEFAEISLGVDVFVHSACIEFQRNHASAPGRRPTEACSRPARLGFPARTALDRAVRLDDAHDQDPLTVVHLVPDGLQDATEVVEAVLRFMRRDTYAGRHPLAKLLVRQRDQPGERAADGLRTRS